MEIEQSFMGAGRMYAFVLYIAGSSRRSRTAQENVRILLETQLKGKYSLEIIDVTENPELASREMILATPTFVKTSPHPEARVLGELSRGEEMLSLLNIPSQRHS